ncbi:hypothetical protein MSG28_003787 [Choristoneura fumiferana]|uniref:Uncharacterized protein n=1 Tax=Choristoneura fumiferana TaxID=7141 RepID=A0ACC0KGP3_CHOFU|nr:hypothetical protein MSG28_003787 [Choristoneura fumiferana]
MATQWISKLRLVLFVLVLALYIYVLVFLKTAYSRSKRLDAIDELAIKNEKLIKHVHGLDDQLGARAERLQDLYEDY